MFLKRPMVVVMVITSMTRLSMLVLRMVRQLMVGEMV